MNPMLSIKFYCLRTSVITKDVKFIAGLKYKFTNHWAMIVTRFTFHAISKTMPLNVSFIKPSVLRRHAFLTIFERPKWNIFLHNTFY